MREICKKDICTACGACENICPKDAVIRQKRWDGSWYMCIDEAKCVNCKLCQRICPSNKDEYFKTPMQAYAGWSVDSEIHRKSASGGIATELYKYAQRNDYYFVGVKLDQEFEAHYQIGRNTCDIENFRNSKYTFSFMDNIYKDVEKILASGKSVVFIGLPCQVAAMKNYLSVKKVDVERLLCVDLVCHGTPSPDFLKQHIKSVDKKKISQECYFRDPKFNTDRFVFSLYSSEEKCIYKRKVKSDDLFQIGYHEALIYRDSCYKCRYAQRQRVGDITISDYHGLGSKIEYKGNRRAVSCILINSEKGYSVINSLKKGDYIQLFERPLLEPLEGEPQFNHPSIAPTERAQFCSEYIAYGDYSLAAKKAFAKIREKSIREGILDLKMLRMKLSLMLSPNEKEKIRKIINFVIRKNYKK